MNTRTNRSPPRTASLAPNQPPAKNPAASTRAGAHTTLPWRMNTGRAITVTIKLTMTLTLLAVTRSNPARVSAASITRPTPAWKAPPYIPIHRKTATVTGTDHGSESTFGFGLKIVRMMIGTSRNPKIDSKVSSATWLIPNAPITEPTTAGPRTGAAPFSPSTPDRRNETTAAPLAASTPTRFEPFAWLPGTPASTSRGTVSAEPPPAIVLMTPAASPPPTNSSASQRVIEAVGYFSPRMNGWASAAGARTRWANTAMPTRVTMKGRDCNSSLFT